LPVRDFVIENGGESATVRSGTRKLDCRIEAVGGKHGISLKEVISVREGEPLEIVV
jgi:hypothetical protein